MKKLKKSLKNNLLKLNLNSSYFVLQKVSSKELDSNNLRNLTRNNIKKIGLDTVVDSNTLKFPLGLKTCNNLKDLQKVIDNSTSVIAKLNNLVFKSSTCKFLIEYNSIMEFVKLKSSIFRIIPLVVLIKGYLNLKNK